LYLLGGPGGLFFFFFFFFTARGNFCSPLEYLGPGGPQRLLHPCRATFPLSDGPWTLNPWRRRHFPFISRNPAVSLTCLQQRLVQLFEFSLFPSRRRGWFVTVQKLQAQSVRKCVWTTQDQPLSRCPSPSPKRFGPPRIRYLSRRKPFDLP
jgi:hypothetical protein